MQQKPNEVRRKLGAGQHVVGSLLASWCPSAMDVAGLAGLDFMRIDCEHSWRQDASLEHVIRAALLGGVEAIVRVDRENPYLVRKALELGAGGIIVPDVYTVEQAEEVAHAAKFPPRGIRGYSGQCLSGGWGTRNGAEWVEWSDSQPMIGVMIENVKALDCLDAILAVDGIDFALFGPADYSMSLGLGRPNFEEPRVRAALEQTIAAARNVGKHVMYNPGSDPAEIERHRKLGITMFEVSSDLVMLHAAWSAARESVRGQQA